MAHSVPSESTSYDDVPYGNVAFAQTHPDRLAATARLFRLNPPAVTTGRVLELGCASGGNLLPMAFNLPEADFVGIDLSRRQIDEGMDIVRALGISNVSLRHASILDVSEDWGEVDYIICHGVFSWVETDVQDAIFRVVRENLSPDGIAYISYNTYPGWHMREPVRQMLRYHAGRFDHPAQQVEQARAFLEFLVAAAPASGPYGELVRREAERLAQAGDSYLYHEHLETTNSPVYFHQFIERAEQAGLQYLAEAEVTDMLASALPPPVAQTLEEISPDILHLEQYMDFVRNRQFRQTLLCHQGLQPERAVNPDVLHGMLLSSRAATDPAPPDLAPGTAATFKAGERRATVAAPATKAAFAVLIEEWPRAIDVGELCTQALQRAMPFLGSTPVDRARSALLADLLAAVLHGMINLHTAPPACTNRPSDKLCAHPLAAFQATTSNVVVNAHHEMVELDALGIDILRLADGKRSRSELVDELTRAQARRRQVERDVELTLSTLVRRGLFVS